MARERLALTPSKQARHPLKTRYRDGTKRIPGIHDCVRVDCGVPVLNNYLGKFASQHPRGDVS